MAENLRFNLEVDNTAAVGSINDFFATFEQGAAKAKSNLNTAFGQGVQTEVKIEFKNGEVIAKQIQSINQESNKLGDIYNAVNGAIGKTPNELKKQISILQQLKGDTAKFQEGTKKVTQEWQTLTQKIKDAKDALNLIEKGNIFQQITESVKGLAGQFALVQTLSNTISNALQGVASGVGNFLKLGADFQVLNISLEAFTGSAEAAKATLAEFQKIAEQSPLNLQQVADAGKLLFAFGLSTDQVKESLKQLAIVSGATGSDITLLARNLGQIGTQGRAFTRDLQQFGTAGIPIFTELETVLGKDATEIRKLAEEGKIGFDEVSQALKNLTADTTPLAEASRRIGETWQGQFEKITSALQKFALAFVQTATDVDNAFGGPAQKSLGAIAALLNTLAANWRTVATVITSATIGLGVFLALSNLAAAITFVRTYIAGIQTVVAVINAWRISTTALGIAQAFLQVLLGNYGAVALGIAAAAGAAVFLNSKLQEQTDKETAASGATKQLTTDTNGLTQAEIELAAQRSKTDLDKIYRDALENQARYKQALDEEITKTEALKTKINERFDQEKARINELITQKNEELTAEKDRFAAVKEDIRTRYELEKGYIDERKQAVQEYYDLEISNLEALTPAEQALADFRRAQLEAKLASGKLTAEETLEIQAQLSRLDRQAEITALKSQKEIELNKIKQDQARLDEQYEIDNAKAKAESEKAQNALKDTLKQYKDELGTVNQKQIEANKTIDAAIKVNEKLIDTIDEIPGIIDQQTRAVYDAKDAYDKAAQSAFNYAQQIRNINSARAGSTSLKPAFAGGPVTGGERRTVNELGQEAFLSASGKLSLINSRPWGAWTAPGAGTIIPAHLTSQLDIPKSGINVNSAARSSGMKASRESNNTARMLRTLEGIMGSNDNIVNNVTIQSDNTTQAASDILVQLTKIRRLRYK